jgi:hypothetical protein
MTQLEDDINDARSWRSQRGFEPQLGIDSQRDVAAAPPGTRPATLRTSARRSGHG